MAIWYASPLSLRVENFPSFQELWQTILQQQEPEVVEWSQTLVYNIWDVRNRVLFRNGQLVVGDVIDRAVGMLAPASPVVREERGGTKAVWGRPHERVIKLNVDASFVDGKGAGLGMVARNHLGEIMVAATSHPIPVLPSLLTEASGFRWTLRLVMELGFRRVCLETDCLQLYQWWQNRTVGRSYLDTIVSDCRSLVSYFDVFSLSFVRRSSNSVADFLAKNASTYADCVWVKEVPDVVSGLVDLDVIASRLVSP
ncbi:uncharacterized protein LOC130719238 [Lotus japonicus]|uniref:uncharacterized protein LOC130719238 n=1 Tax=Lotus japonicus TaxID=34305 RepID=UPI002588C554|nr:uncharacterized protein LOC130719238 [Lotus japonicus]